MTDMTKEQRAELKRQLAAIDAEMEPIYKAREAACEPFDAQLRPLEERRDELLESAPSEIRGECEGCGIVLFFGDMGQCHTDAGIDFCEDCSPTWKECMEQIESGDVKPEHFEEPEDCAHYVALVRERVAEGKGDEKNVWEL